MLSLEGECNISAEASNYAALDKQPENEEHVYGTVNFEEHIYGTADLPSQPSNEEEPVYLGLIDEPFSQPTVPRSIPREISLPPADPPRKRRFIFLLGSIAIITALLMVAIGVPMLIWNNYRGKDFGKRNGCAEQTCGTYLPQDDITQSVSTVHQHISSEQPTSIKPTFPSTLVTEIPNLDLKPELNFTREDQQSFSIVALPNGEAYTSTYNTSSKIRQIEKLNKHGYTVDVIYNCSGDSCLEIPNLFLVSESLYVVHLYDLVLEFSIKDGSLLNEYHTKSTVRNPGTMSPANPHPELLLLIEYNKHEMFTFNLTSSEKNIKPPKEPKSVSSVSYNDKMYYVVCTGRVNGVNIYNASWDHVAFVRVLRPLLAIGSHRNTILVYDIHMARVSEYDISGNLIQHIFDLPFYRNRKPYRLSMSTTNIYLWIAMDVFDVNVWYRYRLDE